MPDDLLEDYIVQHLQAAPTPEIRFSWHGGEPTMLGIDYFRKIVALQRRHRSPGQHISNGIQTNGTLLDEDWCSFFAAEGFSVGISLDGPEELHDHYRVSKRTGRPMPRRCRDTRLLRQYGVPCDVLCVVHSGNVPYPLEVYRFFKGIGVTNLGFLPLVKPRDDGPGVSDSSVPALAFGDFLCTVFDEWLGEDIGRINVQIFEEAIATAVGREHALCIFRKTCGDIPVVEHNGDFFSCDHFVDAEHRLGNIGETPLVELLESPATKGLRARPRRESLPHSCKVCDVLGMCNGGCPKDRFLSTPDGEGRAQLPLRGLQALLHPLPSIRWQRWQAMARARIEAMKVPRRRQGRAGHDENRTQRSLPLRQRPEIQEMLHGEVTTAYRRMGRLRLELLLEEGHRALPREVGGFLVVPGRVGIVVKARAGRLRTCTACSRRRLSSAPLRTPGSPC